MIAHTSAVDHLALVGAGSVAVIVYRIGWLRRPGDHGLAFISWIGGVALVLAATLPAMEGWAQRSFTGHMVQHLVIIVAAAPLLVLAEPMRAFRELSSTPRHASRVERTVGRWWRELGPLVAAASFLAVLYVTHLSAVYDEALHRRWLHDAEHVAYLGCAALLWAATRNAGRRAPVQRVGAVFAVIAGSALLGVVLMSAASPLVPTYVEALGAERALDDQRLAASIMWVGGMATTLPLLLLSVWSWASAEERVAVRSEALREVGPRARRGAVRSDVDGRADFEDAVGGE